MRQVLLQPSKDVLTKRVQARAAEGTHFMPASLLESQLALMEVDPSAYRYGMIQCTQMQYVAMQCNEQREVDAVRSNSESLCPHQPAQMQCNTLQRTMHVSSVDYMNMLGTPERGHKGKASPTLVRRLTARI